MRPIAHALSIACLLGSTSWVTTGFAAELTPAVQPGSPPAATSSARLPKFRPAPAGAARPDAPQPGTTPTAPSRLPSTRAAAANHAVSNSVAGNSQVTRGAAPQPAVVKPAAAVAAAPSPSDTKSTAAKGSATPADVAPPRSLFGLKPKAAKPAELVWHHQPEAAIELAEESGKPLLVVFGGKRCSWCRKLEKETLADPQVARQLAEQFVPLHLDLAEHSTLGEQLGVEALPTTVILSPEGELLARNPGFLPAGKYRQLLQTGLAKLEKQAAAREIQQVSGELPLEKTSRNR